MMKSPSRFAPVWEFARPKILGNAHHHGNANHDEERRFDLRGREPKNIGHSYRYEGADVVKSSAVSVSMASMKGEQKRHPDDQDLWNERQGRFLYLGHRLKN